MWKKREWIMLPSDGPSTISLVLNPSTMKLKINDFKYPYTDYVKLGYEMFHLYLISDEEIKEGDYIITINMPERGVDVYNNELAKRNIKGREYECKKIIATTDILPDYRAGIDVGLFLPQPSTAFIVKFVEEYNRGNIITEVMVEYENNYDLHYYTPAGGIECCNKIDNWKLKISPKDNTITIKKVKDVVKIGEELYSIMQQYHEYCVWMEYITPMKWIEENI